MGGERTFTIGSTSGYSMREEKKDEMIDTTKKTTQIQNQVGQASKG
jgi:hypothetical protein